MNTCEVRAIDAFRAALHAQPKISNSAERWGGLSVCEWQLPWLDGFELTENDDLVIAYHSAGSRKVRAATGGGWSETTSEPGLISVIPPGRKVSYVVDGGVAFSTVHVPNQLLKGLWCGGQPQRHNFRFAFSDPFVVSCMSILLDQARSPSTCNFPYVHSVARALLMHLMQADSECAGSEPMEQGSSHESACKLDRMLDFIEANLAEQLSLELLAETAQVSRAHFARRFRDLTGLSPHQYVRLRRVERAKKLLARTHLGLAQIALEAGFSTQSHFTSVFGEATGETPTQYRRAVRGRDWTGWTG